MRIAVVDDDGNCREEIAELVRFFGEARHCPMEAVPFDNAETFLAAFDREQFPIVFMDIFMDGMDGLTAGTKLWAMDKKHLLIFLTSSEDFRQDALSLHAFEYITKPVAPERVRAVLEDALAALPQTPKYIEVASGRSVAAVYLHEIVSAVTDAHYVNISLADGSTVRSRMTIQEFLRLVEGEPRFIRVNKGIVLNADRIVDFEARCCVMDSGARFPVRVRDQAQVEQAVRAYHFASIRSRQRRAGT